MLHLNSKLNQFIKATKANTSADYKSYHDEYLLLNYFQHKKFNQIDIRQNLSKFSPLVVQTIDQKFDKKIVEYKLISEKNFMKFSY